MRVITGIAILQLLALSTNAQSFDSRHLAVDAQFFGGKIIPHSPTVRNALDRSGAAIYGIGIGYQTLPSDSSVYASAYNYPLLGLRFSISDFKRIRLSENSRLGNIYSIYGHIERTLARNTRWLFFYTLDAGLSYATDPHDWISNPGNPFVGSRRMGYVGGGFGVNYKVSSKVVFGLSAGLHHYSNGRLGMPNSGINMFGTTFNVRYYFDTCPDAFPKITGSGFKKEWQYHISAGMGYQTSLQEWEIDLNGAQEDRRTHYSLRPKFSLSADAMYRYTRKFAAGLGFDMFYTPHTNLLRAWDIMMFPKARFDTLKYSRIALGLSVNHEIYYRNVSLNASFGYYLFRQVGIHDKEHFYQRAGFRYYMPMLRNMFIGVAIKAHRFSQAEYLEMSIGIKFTKPSKKWSK